MINVWNFIKHILDFINKYFKIFVLFIIIILVIILSIDTDIEENPNLAKISLNFPIYESDSIAQQIEEVLNNKDIKGVLLLVDSPGGGVGASIEIADMIKELSEKIPVIAYTQSLMASGAYYAGMYANSIYANRGALIGSIGVIFSSPNIEEAMKYIGVKMQGFSAGEYKEIGTITRTWNKNEKDFIEKLVMEQYKMFYSDVLLARKGKMNTNDPTKFAEGKVFSAKSALELGLIDKIGSMNDAIEELKRISHVDEAIWLKKDKIDMLFDKIIDKSTLKLQSLVTPSMKTHI